MVACDRVAGCKLQITAVRHLRYYNSKLYDNKRQSPRFEVLFPLNEYGFHTSVELKMISQFVTLGTVFPVVQRATQTGLLVFN